MNPITITLNTKTVVENARQYYDKGLLTAQTPEAADAYCVNFQKIHEVTYRCAVAASYPEEWIDTGMSPTFISGIHLGQILTEKPTDTSNITLIQYAHDKWATSRRNRDSEEIIDYAKEAFLSIISHPSAKSKQRELEN